MRLEDIFTTSEIRRNEPMREHTTFQVGGAADVFITVRSESELSEGIRYLTRRGKKYFILGAGSNVVFPDEGYRGTVLSMRGLNAVKLSGERMTAQAGAGMSMFSQKAMRNALSGAEFMAGIPGTIGGGVRMNAGCYGGEFSQIIESVRVLRRGEVRSVSAGRMEFGYRRCGFLQAGDVVLSAVFRLKEGNKNAIADKMREYNSCRRIKQPLTLPSAGSAFKRPVKGYAADLIERAGLKGYRIGGAQVSEKHSGFIVNLGGAKSEDIRKLIDYIQKEVYNIFTIKLEPEIIFAE